MNFNDYIQSYEIHTKKHFSTTIYITHNIEFNINLRKKTKY
jgi:hypothetical protein